MNPRGPMDHRLSRTFSEQERLTKKGIEKLVFDFKAFCTVNLQLTENTAKEHRAKIKRFLNWIKINKRAITKDSIRDYLFQFNGKNPSTYANNLKSIKVFHRDFLSRPDLINSFRFPNIPFRPKKILSDTELQEFYYALFNSRNRALFLLYASSGLRRNEALSLRIADVDFERRMVTPQPHNGRTKHAWISFFNDECDRELKKYLDARKDNNPKLFPMGRSIKHRLWYRTREKTGICITPQMLREWFCNKLGSLGVQDRYIDAFCGRLPKSVLARHYSDYSIEVLERVYRKARLRIL